jgi:hypothetical protein
MTKTDHLKAPLRIATDDVCTYIENNTGEAIAKCWDQEVAQAIVDAVNESSEMHQRIW